MADLIIKPSAVGNQKLVFADQAGNILLKTGDDVAAAGQLSHPTTQLNSGLLQIKQYRKLSVTDAPNSGSLTTVAAPFNGITAEITPATAGNFIRAKFASSVDHGPTWRSGYYDMQWRKDDVPEYWYGIAGAGTSNWGSTAHHGNSVMLSGMFNPNTTSTVRIRVLWLGHSSGGGRRHGQYNNEATDTTNVAFDTDGGTKSVGWYIILEELAAATCTTTNIS
jgi:hypothetical protein